MRKKLIILILCLFLPLMSSGCWSMQATEKLAIVTAIGIDSTGTGNNRIFKFTADVIRPRDMGSSKSQSSGNGSKPYLIVEAEGTTIDEARRNLCTVMSRQIYLSHVRVIILGRQVCRDGLNEVMDYLTRNQQIRLIDYIAVTDGTAHDLFNAKGLQEMDIAKEIYGLMTIGKKVTHVIAPVTLKEFSESMITPGMEAWAPVINLKESADNPESADISGLALFRNDKLAGNLNLPETKSILLMQNKIDASQLTIFLDNGELVKFKLTKSKTQINVSIFNNIPNVEISLAAEGNITEASPNADLEDLAGLEEKIRDVLHRNLTIAFKKTQNYNSDMLGIGRLVEIQNKEYWDHVSENWYDIYSELEPNINVLIKINNLGLRSDSFNSKLRS